MDIQQPTEHTEQVQNSSDKVKKPFPLVNTVFLVGAILALVSSYFRYYYLKDFRVDIETPCDPAFEWCFKRECSTGDCPPNKLSDYRQFTTRDYIFDTCYNTDGCEALCEGNSNLCQETMCDESTDDCEGVK